MFCLSFPFDLFEECADAVQITLLYQALQSLAESVQGGSGVPAPQVGTVTPQASSTSYTA